MKVYINGRFLTQKTTGVQRVAREIIFALDNLKSNGLNHGINFELLVPKDTNLDEVFELKNIKIKKVGKLKGHFWEQLELPFWANKNLLINFCNTGPIFKRNQIVYIHDAAIYSRPIGYSKKFILWYKILFKLISIFSKKIITVSNFSKKELLIYLPNLKEKIEVSYIAANHIDKIFQDDSILDENDLSKGNYFFAVSSMHPNKNFQIIGKVLSQYKNFNGQMVIAGGKNSRVFSNLEFESNQNIKFVGYVTDEQLKSLYRNARAFIFPSYYEGFGLPPLEAMSVGCPVIASNAASIPEVCQSGAIYFNPDDPEDLVECINKIYHQDVKDLSDNGLKRSKKFNWNKTAEDLLNVLRGII